MLRLADERLTVHGMVRLLDPGFSPDGFSTGIEARTWFAPFLPLVGGLFLWRSLIILIPSVEKAPDGSVCCLSMLVISVNFRSEIFVLRD